MRLGYRLVFFMMALGLIGLTGGVELGLGQQGATITVCQEGPPQCDFASIQDAIDKAEEGAAIRVQRGTYLEDLSIKERGSLALAGAGSDQTTLLGSITVETTTGQIIIQGFTLQGGQSYGLQANDVDNLLLADNTVIGSRGPGVDLLDTNAILNKNVIKGHLAQGLVVSGSRAHLMGNRIEGNGGAGLEVTGESAAILEDNQILRNEGDGISVTKSTVQLVGNRILQNGGCGIRVVEEAALSGRENVVARNQAAPSDAENPEFPELCGTPPPSRALTANIRQIPQDAPTIEAALRAIPEEPVLLIAPGVYPLNLVLSQTAELRGMDRERVVLMGTAAEAPLLRVRGGQVQVQVQVQVTLRQLTLRGAAWGLEVLEGAQVGLQAVRVVGNRQGGIRLSDEARLTAEDVQVAGNRGPGLLLQGSSRAQMEGVTVSGNDDHGVILQGGALVAFQNSQINGNGRDGILVRSQVPVEDGPPAPDGQLVLLDSELSGNRSHGVEVQQGMAFLLGNHIWENGLDGVWVGGFADLQENRIMENGRCGVEAQSGAAVIGSGNELKDNAVGNLCPSLFPWPPDFVKG